MSKRNEKAAFIININNETKTKKSFVYVFGNIKRINKSYICGEGGEQREREKKNPVKKQESKN
jgi:hypothetical protein